MRIFASKSRHRQCKDAGMPVITIIGYMMFLYKLSHENYCT